MPENPTSKPWLPVIVLGLIALIGHGIVALIPANAPPGRGDAPLYDNIAFNIARGRGFSLDLSNPQFLAPYRQSDKWHDKYAPELLNHPPGPEPTTSRPLGYPVILAIQYITIGRIFWVSRLLNALMFTVGITATVWTAHRIAGTNVAWLAGLLLLIEPITYEMTDLILTEPTTFMLIGVFMAITVACRNNANRASLLTLGILLGILFWVRSIFIVCIPFIILAVMYQHRRNTPASTPGNRMIQSLTIPGWLLPGLLLLIVPLAARHCWVLQSCMPLGTQGAMQLPAEYSDLAWQRAGLWDRSELPDPEAMQAYRRGRLTLPQLEYANAKAAQRQAIQWICANPGKTMALPWLKLAQLLSQSPAYHIDILIILGLFSLTVTHWRHALAPIWALIGSYLFAIMLTHAIEGARFTLPLLPPAALCAAMGIWRLVSWWQPSLPPNTNQS